MPSTTLEFTQQSNDETSFEVHRKTAGGSFAFLTSIAADATAAPSLITVQDLSVLAGVTYAYRVRALNGGLASAWSNEAFVTISGDPPPPPPVPDDTDLGGYRPQMPRAYGMTTPGGRGNGEEPTIIRVNTLTWGAALSAVGDGTLQGGLKAALQYSGPAYILLEDSGVISAGQDPVNMSSPYKTIAGQCAPSPGVNIEGGGANGSGGAGSIEVNTHDVIVQHLRSRAGHAGSQDYSGLGVWYYGSAVSHHVVFDHVSVNWGLDENFYAIGSDITFWRCLCAESLYGNTIGQGLVAGHGILFGAPATDCAVIGCLLISCGRGPELHEQNTIFIGDTWNHNGCGPAAMNNPAASLWYQPVAGRSLAAYINFTATQGPDTPDGYAAIQVYYNMPGNQVYIRDQVVEGYVPFVFTGTDPRVGVSPVAIPPGWASVGSAALEAWVVANVGARPLDRDAADSRYMTELGARTGQWIQSPSAVGGFYSLAHNHATFTVPGNPFGDLDTYGRNNLDRALETAALALEP